MWQYLLFLLDYFNAFVILIERLYHVKQDSWVVNDLSKIGLCLVYPICAMSDYTAAVDLEFYYHD